MLLLVVFTRFETCKGSVIWEADFCVGWWFSLRFPSVSFSGGLHVALEGQDFQDKGTGNVSCVLVGELL